MSVPVWVIASGGAVAGGLLPFFDDGFELSAADRALERRVVLVILVGVGD